ncbi:double zinc ribbon domain-containing protein [Pectinatus brassicae]|uniref:Putative nucleic acid-binding Zn ribbon protein n=1 Tax=Pectinatus brassicae TaxID=862415 RepID=A0A840UFI6_9FIRM|nr:zinc ribbon domain-containing protein [Pectinatus brassicae]MBB5335856.1 putative nucleic acid-binding Zn ribbon protein [Pectinatus brassicae]
MIRCPYCAKYINEDDEFCRFCGQSLQEKKLVCPVCGEHLNLTMQTCPSCGQELKSLLLVDKHLKYQRAVRRKIMIFSLIFILLAAGITSYVFFRQRELNNYNLQVSYYIQTVNNTNKILAAMFIKDKNLTPEECRKQLQIQAKNIDEINKKNAALLVPQEYNKLAADMKQLLINENNLIQQLLTIVNTPVKNSIDADANKVKNNIKEIKRLAATIAVAEQKITIDNNFLAINDNVLAWVKKLRNDYEQNNKQFTNMAQFLAAIETDVQEYEIIKERLPDILSNLRKGGYTWAEYFSELDKAEAKRTELQGAVDNITANVPEGAVLRQSLHNVLSISLQYVRAARQAARIEFEDNDYKEAKPYYDKAEIIHQREEDVYKSFIKQYDDEKKNQEKLQILVK